MTEFPHEDMWLLLNGTHILIIFKIVKKKKKRRKKEEKKRKEKAHKGRKKETIARDKSITFILFYFFINHFINLHFK